MRVILVLAVMVSLVATLTAQSKGAGGAPAPSACSILTNELVLAHSPASKQSKDMLFKIPPQEDKIGPTGSACQNGDVMLQINPFPLANFDAMFGKWAAVPGVGDKAHFRDNRGEWAELAVVASGRVITVQMDVPSGKKAADIQSNTVALRSE